MKVWYLYYNEQTKQIDYAEHLVKDIHGSWETPSNIDEYKCQCYTEEAHAIEGVKSCNEDLKWSKLHIHKCKDCGIYFYTSLDEERWFEYRNMYIPKRCEKCRHKRHKSA